MAIGNGELMHECFLKYLRMGTARMKYDKEAEEGVWTERSEYGKKQSGHEKKETPTAYHILIKNTVIINIIL